MVRNDKNWWNGTKEARKDLANKVKDYNGSKKDLKNVLSGKKTDMTLDQAKGNVKGKYKDVQNAKGKLDGKIKEGEQLKKDHSKELQKIANKNKVQCYKNATISDKAMKEIKKMGPVYEKKFKEAIEKGLVPPEAKNGIKKLSGYEDGYTHEIKIGGSGARVLGKENSLGDLVFDKFKQNGLHK